MDDNSKLIRKELKKRPYPDMSHIEPPTEHAADKMVRNLRAANKPSKKKSKPPQ